jgi:hypothetical protein
MGDLGFSIKFWKMNFIHTGILPCLLLCFFSYNRFSYGTRLIQVPVPLLILVPVPVPVVVNRHEWYGTSNLLAPRIKISRRLGSSLWKSLIYRYRTFMKALHSLLPYIGTVTYLIFIKLRSMVPGSLYKYVPPFGEGSGTSV